MIVRYPRRWTSKLSLSGMNNESYMMPQPLFSVEPSCQYHRQHQRLYHPESGRPHIYLLYSSIPSEYYRGVVERETNTNDSWKMALWISSMKKKHLICSRFRDPIKSIMKGINFWGFFKLKFVQFLSYSDLLHYISLFYFISYFPFTGALCI